MKTLTIRGREYTVTVRPADDRTPKHGVVYELAGTRGARYFTMRNANRPEQMFVCDARGFGMASMLKGCWLTDKNGSLEILVP